MTTDLRLGRWQDVLIDVECDTWIADPPYGARTHRGHDLGAKQRKQMLASDFQAIDYECLTPAQVLEICEWWSPRTRGWFCVLTSHDLIQHWEAGLQVAGRYVFAPLPVLGFHQPRLLGDGPGSCVVHLIVARPRRKEFMAWGSLPSRYDRSEGDPRPDHMGGKGLGVMRAIVRDYSRPGDLVCDPFAGSGTTLRAALEEGRRAVGCELAEKPYAKALARLVKPVAPQIFDWASPEGEQTTLEL